MTLRPGLQLPVVMVVALASLAPATWQPEGASKGDATTPANCGAVVGVGGAWDTFTVVLQTGSFLGSHGAVGGRWVGSQYTLSSAAPPIVADEHRHEWLKHGSANASARTLQGQSDTTCISQGTCSRLHADEMEWWWRPTVAATSLTPTVQVWSGTAWTDASWTGTFADFHDATFAATQPTGTEPTPAPPNYTPSHGRFTFTMPQGANGTKVRVVWPLTSSVSATVDNALVPPYWAQGLHVDCATKVSSASASSDFADLWYQ